MDTTLSMSTVTVNLRWVFLYASSEALLVPALGKTDSSPVLATSDSSTYSIGGEFVNSIQQLNVG